MDGSVGCGQQSNRGDLAAAAAGAVATGHCIIVIVVQQQALAVTAGLDRAFGETRRGIWQPAEELEA